jgi:hypothetical protein
MTKSKLLIAICVLAAACPPHSVAAAGEVEAWQQAGVGIDGSPAAKNLVPVGRVDAQTTVYTDTQGLNPPVDMGLIQGAGKFINTVPATGGEMQSQSRREASNVQQVNPPQKTIPPQPANIREDRFSEYDGNHNGWISREEFMVMELKVRAGEIFTMLDTDNNKALSRAEFAVHERQGSNTRSEKSSSSR